MTGRGEEPFVPMTIKAVNGSWSCVTSFLWVALTTGRSVLQPCNIHIIKRAFSFLVDERSSRRARRISLVNCHLETWIYKRGGIGQPFCFPWYHCSLRENFGNKMAAPMVLHPECLLSSICWPLLSPRQLIISQRLFHINRFFPGLFVYFRYGNRQGGFQLLFGEGNWW